MDVNTLVQVISTVGFPIACCIYLVYNQNKAEERHRDEVDKLRSSLDNNTKVMNRICTILKIETEGDDHEHK